MKKSRLLGAFCAYSISIVVSTATHAATFTPLPFLPGGFSSEASNVSEDGTVVIGTDRKIDSHRVSVECPGK